MKKISNVAKVIGFVIFVFVAVPAIKAGSLSDKADFFSYKRFFIDQGILSNLSGDGKIHKDLYSFVGNFTDGLYAFSNNRFKGAEKFFLRARQLWPEYFNTDLLLALVYENLNKHKISARYHKSYLGKLKKFEKGEYHVSEGLIRALTANDIVPYEGAHALIKERLSSYAVYADIDKVRPVFTSLAFFFPIFILLITGGIFMAVRYRLYPYLQRQNQIKYPPEGFWVCRNCYKTNPNLRKECERCARIHE
ncbi:MAG: hypothetical protein ABH844_05140 [Candidatus Omnitrophota bacterium]